MVLCGMVLCGMYQGGKRPRGRPTTRWTDKVRDMNMGVEWVARVIKDGTNWDKGLLDTGCGEGEGEVEGVYMSAVPKGGAMYLLENRHRIITSTVSGGVKTEKAEGVRWDRE